MIRPMVLAVVVSAVIASTVSSLITFSLSRAISPARPVQTVRVEPRVPDYTSEQFLATRDGDRRAVLTAVEDGVGLMLAEGRRPRVHLFAQHDGQEGLAFYDQSGTLRSSLFVQPDGEARLSFYGPDGQLVLRLPEH